MQADVVLERLLRTFTKDNVELEIDGIERVTPRGIVTTDGREIELDTLILATGFEVFDPASSPAFDIEGVDGVDLRSHWKASRFRSYEGVTVPEFPNLFLLPGPYGILGSYFVTIDATTGHAIRCVQEAERQNATHVEVRPAADDAFFAEILHRRRRMIFFAGDCSAANTFYLDHHGDVPFIRPQSGPGMLWRSKHFPLDDYVFTAQTPAAGREMTYRRRSGAGTTSCPALSATSSYSRTWSPRWHGPTRTSSP